MITAKNKGFRALIIFFIFYLTCKVKSPIKRLVRMGDGLPTDGAAKKPQERRKDMEKFWKDGEFTPFANRIMYAACWVLGIAGFYVGSM